MKKPLLCYLGWHKDVLLRSDKVVPHVYGPFDPNQKRTKTISEFICAQCGRKKDHDPFLLYI